MREGEGAVRLQQLSVGLDPHLPDVVACVCSQVAVQLELTLQPNCAGQGRDGPHTQGRGGGGELKRRTEREGKEGGGGGG